MYRAKPFSSSPAACLSHSLLGGKQPLGCLFFHFTNSRIQLQDLQRRLMPKRGPTEKPFASHLASHFEN